MKSRYIKSFPRKQTLEHSGFPPDAIFLSRLYQINLLYQILQINANFKRLLTFKATIQFFDLNKMINNAFINHSIVDFLVCDQM